MVPNFLSASEISTLLSETNSMLSNLDLTDHPMTKFTTGDQDSHVSDSYFLTSGDKIRFFFEPAAFSSQNDGNLLRQKERAINKIGHYLHELSPAFKDLTLSPAHAAIARSLGFRDPRVLQSMVICKQPEIGGAVPRHQDSTFLYTDPPSAVGFWIALEDATVGNGCLSFAAGSQKWEPVRKRFVKRTEGEGTEFVDVQGGRFPRGEDGRGGEWPGEGEVDVEGEEYMTEEVKAGTLVLIHGNLLHKSEKNLSGKSRFIYTFHVIEGENEYDERNWLQPPEMGFSRLYDYSGPG